MPYTNLKVGMWELTPWYFRLLGKQKYRRKVTSMRDTVFWMWEYTD